MSDVNILLLGETGVGKTTVINALSNHLRYENLTDAVRGDFTQLVPATVRITDENGDDESISTGAHSNELQQPGVSATQNPIIHNISYGTRNVKIIDTPGLGDTRGAAYNEANLKKLFKLLQKLGHLNAICIVLKANDTRLNAIFSYCMNNIISQFNTALRDNVIFLFTNSRVSHFTPGESSQVLKTCLKQSEESVGLIVPFNKANTFCVDNETFRYLVFKSRGVEFTDDEVEAIERSWDASSKEYRRLLSYGCTLPTFSVHTIVSLRDSKVAVARMATPLIEILVLHEKTIAQIKMHRDLIKERENSIEDLQSRMYVPIIQYKITKKVITNSKSSSKINVGGFFNGIFGIEASVKHKSSNDTHTEEHVEPYETQIEDSSVKFMLSSEKQRLEMAKEKLEELETMQTEYGEESKIIMETTAKFITFVNENAALACQDPFELYLEQVLDEERKCSGSVEFINKLETLLTRYKLMKRNMSNITSYDIQDAIGNLLRLTHAGPQFRQLYNRLLC